jgi:hypothetical protein
MGREYHSGVGGQAMSIESTYEERNPASARLYQRAGKVLFPAV